LVLSILLKSNSSSIILTADLINLFYSAKFQEAKDLILNEM
jgi:hypothetical protein